jgi:hypothetical protein
LKKIITNLLDEENVELKALSEKAQHILDSLFFSTSSSLSHANVFQKPVDIVLSSTTTAESLSQDLQKRTHVSRVHCLVALGRIARDKTSRNKKINKLTIPVFFQTTTLASSSLRRRCLHYLPHLKRVQTSMNATFRSSRATAALAFRMLSAG